MIKNFPARSRQILSFAVVAVCAACWLSGGALLESSAAQTRNQNANVKKTTPTPKKTTATTAKSTAKPSPKITPKTTPKPPASPQFVVTGFNVNVREDASTTAPEVGQLKFGAIAREIERTKERETVGGKTDFWHKINAGGKSGWVFGGFLKTLVPTKRETIYKQITADKFKFARRSFDENAELYEFLTRAQNETKTRSIAADLGLWRLQALKGALEAIPFDKLNDAPYKTFTDAHSLNITYNEPAGQWHVRSDRFWSLSKKYADLPVGERIAWEAARNPLPGECEGYLNCYLFALRETHGEYLRRYPKGAHAAEALKAVRDFLQPIAADAGRKEIYTTPADVSDRADFYQKIAELRGIVSRTGFFDKEAVLIQLDKIAEGYR